MVRWLFIVSLMLISFMTSAQNRQELEKEKEETLREIQISKDLLEKTTSQKQNTIRRVTVLNRGIRSRQSLISTIGKEVLEIEARGGGLDEILPHIAGSLGPEFIEKGNVDIGSINVGQSIGLIKEVVSCKELLDRIAKEAEETINKVKAVF